MLLLTIVVGGLLLFWSARDREKAIAPGIWLSWEGGKYDILVGRLTQYKGIQPSPGGIVIVNDVVALEVIGEHYLIGKTRQGSFFLVSLDERSDQKRDADAVMNFTTEKEWTEACQARGILPPVLHDPWSAVNPD